MASPEPPVALKNHCSIIHDNVLYVYSPDAFLTLPLDKNATWSQEPNGISVTGAQCVKGGVDGDSSNPALYIVGGVTNSSTPQYSGIQRYSLNAKTWEIINPITAVTANRLNHGATYLNASSSILVYGGSQDGDDSYSTETFLMLMYPPYRVQAYSSIAPPVLRPIVLPWDNDRAVMVGGGPTNDKVFRFHPDPGWVDLGLTLPNALPDTAVTQCALQTLDDGSKILQTFTLDRTPNVVSGIVLAGAGGAPATVGETVGAATQSAGAASPTAPALRFLRKRQNSLQDYPAYNDTAAPTVTRSNFALATGNSNLLAIVGGDANDTVNVFDSSANSWLSAQRVFGDVQKPLTTSSSATPTTTPTATQAPAPASSSTAAGEGSSSNHGLAILGGVLGGICGLAAILIIALLYLRSVKRKRAAAAKKNEEANNKYPEDKPRGGISSFEDDGMKPLSQQAQPMGRSPIPSAAISEADSIALFSNKISEKDAGPRAMGGSKLNPQHNTSGSIGQGFFNKKEKSPLQISKPMLPDLGDYQERPSINLGKATPAATAMLAPVAAAAAVTAVSKADQRKTDEGWAKYFVEDKEVDRRATIETDASSDSRPNSRPTTSKGGGGGFWPGSGVPQTLSSNRSTKLPLRDSAGNPLNNLTVAASSPNLEVAPSNEKTRNLSIVAPHHAKISRPDSISTENSSEDDYEDDRVDGYSSGIPESVRDSNAWNPIGNTWSGPAQRPVRTPSVSIGATAFPPPTSMSEATTNTSGSGGSSIPAFPVSNATLQRAGPHSQTGFAGLSTVQHPAPTHFATTYQPSRKSSMGGVHGGPPVADYFGPAKRTSRRTSQMPDSTDMSWLNLGTPAHDIQSPSISGSEDHSRA